MANQRGPTTRRSNTETSTRSWIWFTTEISGNGLVVGAGADPGVIQLAFDGVESMRIAPEGDLLLRVAGGEVRQHKPVVYQEADGIRQAFEGRYVRRGNREVGFKLRKYDVRRPMAIRD